MGSLLRFFARRQPAIPVETSIAFDVANEDAVRWAERHAAMLITEINSETRAAIRVFVAEAINNGVPPAKLAKQIRSVVGLHSRQAVAVLNAQMRMENAAPGSLVKVGKVRVRVPSTGLPAGRIRQVARDYADRLLRQRSIAIARTETLAASNEGQRQIWAKAQASGVISDTVEREWIVTPDDRACPVCTAADGQRRRLDEPFIVGGFTVMNPPAHPLCRCAQGISIPEAKRRTS